MIRFTRDPQPPYTQYKQGMVRDLGASLEAIFIASLDAVLVTPPNMVFPPPKVLLPAGQMYESPTLALTTAQTAALLALLAGVGGGAAAVTVANQATSVTLTAATTVDVVGVSYINLAQTTAGVTITIPPLTAASTNIIIAFSNTGSVAVTVAGVDTFALNAGEIREWSWNGVGWKMLGVTLTPAQVTQLAIVYGQYPGQTTFLNRSINVSRAVGLSRGLLATFQTNVATAGGIVGTDLLQTTIDKIQLWLDAFMRTTAWPKIRELWVPIADTSTLGGLNAARVKLKYPAGAAAALTNSLLTMGDYTPMGGINTAAGTGKRLTSDFNPSTASPALPAGEQGFMAYCFGTGSRGAKGVDQATAAATVAFAGYTGAVMGSSTNSNFFAPLAASLIGRISGGTVSTAGQGRCRAMQQTAGVAQAWAGGYLSATLANASPTQNNSVICVAGANAGDANNFSGSIGGYAYFDTLTAVEMGDVADFFDNINIALGRPVFFEELLAHGDSNTFAVGNGPTPPSAAQRWSALLAADFSLIENNQGYSGSSILATNPNSGTQLRLIQRLFGTSARVNVLMWGTNDIANATTVQSLIDYEAAVVAAKRARVQNIILLGVGTVDWVAAAVTYAGTGFATNPHDNTQVPAWNAAVKAMAARQGVGYYDISTVPNALQTDGVHNTIANQPALYSGIAAAIRSQVL